MKQRRAAIYCRISSDPTGLRLGVERQREDCEGLVLARGWTMAAVYEDNDVSAYSGKPRPSYARLLDDVAAGKIDVIVAWHPDRLHRSPAELEEFIALVDRKRVDVETVKAGQWDLSRASGRLIARQLGGIARYESEQKSERMKRALQQKAAAGSPHGPAPYGWAREYDTNHKPLNVVEPAQAAIVREIADRIIGGDSLNAITTDINARAIAAPRGGAWRKQNVRSLVLRDRNAGVSTYHGQEVAEGSWDPILDRSTYEQVKAILCDPVRRTSTGTAAAHLLSGIARCGLCGSTMRSGYNRATPSYRCAARSCVARKRDWVDEYVTEVVIARLQRPDAATALLPRADSRADQAAEDARGIRARLDSAADDYADGKIDGRQLQRITARLRPQLDAAQAQLKVINDRPLLAGLVGPDVREAWAKLSLTRRRAVVDLLMTVTVHKTRSGSREFIPESVSIEWRG